MPNSDCHAPEVLSASLDVARVCDVMEIAIVVVDTGGNVAAINKQARQLLGYTSEELVGQPVELLVPSRYRVAHERLRAEFLEGPYARRGAAKFEVKALCKDGRELDVQIGLTKSSTERGLMIAAAIRDLTAIKRDQREAHESRRTLNTLISNLPGMVYRCQNDFDWTMEYVNDACEALTGYQASDLMERRIDWMDLIHPDDRTGVWDGVQAGIAKKQPFSRTYRIIAADGTQKWVWEQGCGVYDAIGEVVALEGFITDITESHEAIANAETWMNRCQKVIEASGNILFDWDPNSGEVVWGGRIEQILGYTPGELGSWEWWIERVVDAADRQAFVCETERCLRDRDRFHLQYHARRKDDTRLVVEQTGHFLASEGGEAQRLLGLVVDVTERWQAEERVHLSEERFELAVRGTTDGLWDWNIETGEEWWSERFRELIGYSEAELPSAYDSWAALLHPDDRDAVLAHLKQHLDSDAPFSIEYRLNTKHHGYRWFHVRGVTVRDEHGKPVRMAGSIQDITLRKRAEDELRNSERRYQALAEVAPVGIFRTDAEGTCIYANDRWCQLTGQTAEQARGSAWVRALHPEDCKRVAREWELAVRQSRPIRLEFRLLPPDGEEVWVYGQAAAETDADGRVLGYVGTLTDITDMKHADRMIRESNERFEQLAENVNQIFWVTDWKNKKLLYVNSAYERIFGRSCESIYADRRSWLELVHPEDRERVAAAFADAAEAGETVDAEYRVVRDDGETRWVYDTAIPVFDDEGRVDRILGIANDITARKDAERDVRDSETRFRQLAENIDEVFWLQDAASRALLYVSPAYETVFGRSVESLMRDRSSWVRMVHSEDRAAAKACFAEGALLGEPVDLEYRIVRDDGEERWLYDRAVPILDEDGRIVRVAGIAHDITERKRAERAREDLAAQLRHSQKMEAVGTLASGVAHDFNNVLTAVIGYLEVARANAPEGVLGEALDGIRRATQQAVDITKAMLMFSRRSFAAKAPMKLGQVVEESVRLLRSMIPACIDIRTETAGTDDLWVDADATQIQQVVMNLSVNARDAMLDGGELRLLVRRVEGGAALIVEDTGTGMSDDVRRRLFEPFFTTKTRGQGTGLGMAIVHGIVQDHGGRIAVDSKHDRGTRITVTLPECEARVALPRPTPPSRGMVDGHGQTILLAEDHEQVRQVAARALTSVGFTVLEAGTGVEAMSTFQNHGDTIDVLVVDIDLPGQSGLTCLRQIRSRRAAVPVVIITGSPEFALEEDFAGSLVLLRKPFTPDELLQATGEARRILDALPARIR